MHICSVCQNQNSFTKYFFLLCSVLLRVWYIDCGQSNENPLYWARNMRWYLLTRPTTMPVHFKFVQISRSAFAKRHEKSILYKFPLNLASNHCSPIFYTRYNTFHASFPSVQFIWRTHTLFLVLSFFQSCVCITFGSTSVCLVAIMVEQKMSYLFSSMGRKRHIHTPDT